MSKLEGQGGNLNKNFPRQETSSRIGYVRRDGNTFLMAHVADLYSFRNGTLVPLTRRWPCVGGEFAGVFRQAYTFYIRFIYVLSMF